MVLKSIFLALFLFLDLEALNAQPVLPDQPLPEFMGQAVTVLQPKSGCIWLLSGGSGLRLR